MTTLGIMQGRLSPPSPEGPQSFPWATWEVEFDRAAACGFDAVEWLFELRGHDRNPLASPEGRRAMARRSAESGVAVNTVCAHCVLQAEPFSPNAADLLQQLVGFATEAGVAVIVVPLLEGVSLLPTGSMEAACHLLRPALARAEREGPRLALETDLDAAGCETLLAQLASPAAGLCYDCGNATSFGHDIATDAARLLPHIAEVHVKDRFRSGPSTLLGQADTDFPAFFAALTRWSGPIVLETPAGDAPEDNGARHAAFVRRFLGA